MKRPDRVFPHPWLSVSLLIGWLLLMNSVSVGNVIMAAVLATLIPWLTHVFWPRSPHRLRFGRLLVFACRVLSDIVLANLQVARLILGSRRRLRPAFVHYPLQLQQDFSISVLASTISLTPGTVSADISPDRSTLLIHGLDVGDEQALIDHIRQRYEEPIREIFECSTP